MVKLPAPADTPEPPRAVPELPLRHRITEDGLGRLRNAGSGSVAGKPAPRNADASLVAWGRKFTKGKPPA